MNLAAESFRRIETPAARNSDPLTSHLAAEQHTRSGRRGAQMSQAIAAVRAHPGHTSQELCELTHLDRYMLARRLPEAETAGEVKKGVVIECSVTRRKAHVWWPK